MEGAKMIKTVAILAVLAIALDSNNAVAQGGQHAASVRPAAAAAFGSAQRITPLALGRIFTTNSIIYIFDTRSRAEFEVSRISNSRRLDPASDIDFFAERYARRAKGRIFVFYCTASSRSTMIAELTADQLIAGGAAAVYVLEGGLLAWANADHPLVNSRGPTRLVHPHDQQMAKLLRDPSRVWLPDPTGKAGGQNPSGATE
jgi:rhodanese-related sulfurtransferase